jgi:aminopeptidase N
MKLNSLPTLYVLLFLTVPFSAAPGADDETGCSSRSRFSAIASPAASAGSGDLDVLYYRLDIRVSISSTSLTGSVLVRARAVAGGVNTMSLDLAEPMVVDSVRSAGIRLPVTRYPSSFTTQLTRSYDEGETVETEVYYHGSPEPSGFGSFVFGAHTGGPWIWSLSQPYGARDWWPCKDHPLDKADSADIRITVPAQLTVGSNGVLRAVRQNPDGTTTYDWAERYPIATYLISVAIAEFSVFSNWYRYSPTDSLQILNYVLPQHFASAQQQLPRTVDMLRIFSGLYGPYPFLKEKYGHCEFGRGGAMEHQTMTSTTTFEEDVIAHELAHQWFGDMITCATWQDLWLNEGFATYSESLYREAQYGPSEYRRLIRARMTSALTASGTLFVQDTSSVANLFAANRVYAKGASVLHMLRHVLGEVVFFRALQNYAADTRLRYRTASTSDFQSVCEAASGRSLAWFFNEWVYGEKYPRYETRWTAVVEQARFRIQLTIHQETRTSNPAFFTMPVDIRLSAGLLDTSLVLFQVANDQEFSFTTSFRPERVDVDPGQWILRELVEPNPELPSVAQLEQNYPNPFNAGTTIIFHLPQRSATTLTVHNTIGQTVATLIQEVREPGSHTILWAGTDDRGRPLASGMYYARLSAGSSIVTRPLLYLK